MESHTGAQMPRAASRCHSRGVNHTLPGRHRAACAPGGQGSPFSKLQASQASKTSEAQDKGHVAHTHPSETDGPPASSDGMSGSRQRASSTSRKACPPKQRSLTENPGNLLAPLRDARRPRLSYGYACEWEEVQIPETENATRAQTGNGGASPGAWARQRTDASPSTRNTRR